MRTVLIGFCLFISTFAAAQKNCFTDAYLEQQKTQNPELRQRVDAIERFIHNQLLSESNTTFRGGVSSGVIRIPVVVHVIYKDASQNISDAQINSQIDALSRD